MKNLFPQYYRPQPTKDETFSMFKHGLLDEKECGLLTEMFPSDDRKQAMLARDALIVFDTAALLNFYTCSEAVLGSLFQICEKT